MPLVADYYYETAVSKICGALLIRYFAGFKYKIPETAKKFKTENKNVPSTRPVHREI